MSFHFPLINRSGQKKSIIETLGFWDMDLQLGKPLQFFENHHQTCIQLEVINQKIRKWLDFSESELVSIFTPSLSVLNACPAKKDFEKCSFYHSHYKLIQQLEEVVWMLEGCPVLIRYRKYLGALRHVCNLQPYENMESIVHALRKYCASDEFFKEQDKSRRREDKAHCKIIEWVNEIFEEYNSLQVVHLVLRSTFKMYLNESSWDELRLQRQTLIDIVCKKKNPEFVGLVGYLWKVYYQPQGGLQLIIMLLFDSKVCNGSAANIATRVGKIWVNEVTKNNGVALTKSLKRDFSNKKEKDDPSIDLGSQVGRICRGNVEEVFRLQSFLEYLKILDILCEYTVLNEKLAKYQRPRSQGQGSGVWRSSFKLQCESEK